MIRSFRHKGLKCLFEEDDTRGLNAEHIDKLRRVLARMDVRANWRVIFQFEEGNVLSVDYVDYH